MKKRLICLVLCLAMLLLPALVACSKKDEGEEGPDVNEASKHAKSLTMWVVSENKLSDETINAVSEAMNSITKSKFKTQLSITYLTKSQYEASLTAQIENLEKYREANGLDVVTQAATTADGEGAPEITEATETLANGMSIIKYPELTPYQTDIVYIAGEDMFNDYVNRGWLAPLDEYLDGSAKRMREYISETLLSATELNGVTYAVPNNNVIGEYKYMLLDKELMNKYSQQGYITQNKIDGFFNQYLQNFLLQVKSFEPDYIPVDASYEDCLALLGHYWNVDPTTYDLLEDFSVFGYHYTDLEDLSRGSVVLGYNSLFEDEEFTNDFLKLNEMKFNGYFNGDLAEADRKTKAAVKFVDGDSTVLDTYRDDYYAVVVQYPTASTDDIYSHMFGVCAYSTNKERAVEVISYLNTNAQFRNLFQYGIENIHYRLDTNEEGTKTELVRLNNDYMMELYATGNAFLAYPEPDMSEDIWENGKIQNRSSLVSPLLGFNIKDFAVANGAKKETVKLPDEKYIATYSSGYSKEVLSQNDIIKDWINAADANPQKGVFVLKSQLQEGQNLTVNYFIYNNKDTDKVFTLEGTSRKEESKDKYGNVVKNENGEVVMKITGFDLSFSYVDGKPQENGYELTCLTVHTTKAMDFALAHKDGTYQENVAKKLVSFDTFNTASYTVDVYDNLSKAQVSKNAELLTWLNECDKATDKFASKTFVKQYTNPTTGEVTYVVYRASVQSYTEVSVQVTGGETSVNVNLDYRYDEESKDKPDTNYLLYYVRINPRGNAKITTSCTIRNNGEKTTSGVIKQTAETDPDFLMLGNLDTELVKYMYDLNRDIVAVLNNVEGATPEEKMANLTAIVAEIKTLLSTDEDQVFMVKAEELVYLKDIAIARQTVNTHIEVIDNEEITVTGPSLDEMHYNILCATSTDKVSRSDRAFGTQWIDPNNKDTKEEYAYFDSLYAIYQKWMSAYGYLPKD